MPTVEERVAYLEGRVEDHGRGLTDLGDGFVRLDHRMDGLDQKIDRVRDDLGGRIDGLDLKIDRFREALTGRIDAVAVRVDGLDLKIDRFREELAARIGQVDAKVDRVREELSAKMSSQFLWLVGLQVSVLLAVVGALVAGLQSLG